MQQDILNNYFIIQNKMNNETNVIFKEQYKIILNSIYGNFTKKLKETIC